MAPSTQGPRVLTPVGAMLLYAGTAVLGFALEPGLARALPVYLAPGVGLALLWRFGTGIWPAIAVGAAATGLLRGWPPATAALGAATATLSLIVVCHGLRARDFRGSFARLHDALNFLLVVTAVFSVSGLLLGVLFRGVDPEASMMRIAAATGIGTTLGILIVGPPLLMWTSRRARGSTEMRQRPIESASLFLLLLVACDAAFGGWLGSGRMHYPLAFLPFPILLWMGFRLGPLPLVTGASVASVAAVYGTIRGLGPFAGQPPTEQLALDWLFLATMQVTFLVLGSAIGERRDADDALRAEKERAESATRAKSEFLSVMNHELRTPLNSILLATDLMLESDLSDEQRDLGQTVLRAGEALRTLVSDTLDMARIEEGRLELMPADFSPTELSRGVIDLFADAARRKGIRLDDDVDPRLPRTLRGDAARLRQVLINLVGNALKFTTEGAIHVRTECRSQEPGLVRVRWEVRDSGPGIEDSDLAAIFEPFTQVDAGSARAHGGTGLGLAISKRLVELMGGEIGVRSARGRGSTFWLTIPLYTVPARGTAETPEAAAEVRRDAVA